MKAKILVIIVGFLITSCTSFAADDRKDITMSVVTDPNQGYNAIPFGSEHGSGTNLVINNFENI